MVVLHHLHLVGEAEGRRELHFIFRLVCTVPAALLTLPEYRVRQPYFSGQLRHVIRNAVFIDKLRLRKAPVLSLIPEVEPYPPRFTTA